ncbi:MAG: hypothetical protein WC935_00195 [Thermoleophilia bacterium]
MADGNGLFAEVRQKMDNDEVPDNLSRAMLWGALAVVYKKLDCFATKDALAKRDANWKKERKIWLAVGGFLLLTHLQQVVVWGETLWKFVVAL